MAAEHEALQILTLAQRTAEDHVNGAHHEADRICGEARDQAAHIVRDAQAHGEALRREAETTLSEARAAAAQIVNDAQMGADQAQQEAEEIRSEARTRADELVKIAQDKADELQRLAEQRYEDVVGSLAARREALQQQIEALERFDRDYRGRLQAFMQAQLRALWVEEPAADADALEYPDTAPPAPPVPTQRDRSGHTSGDVAARPVSDGELARSQAADS